MRLPAAVFITRTRDGELRGCIGSLEAREPLAQAVANSAYSAAFHDRRFSPLQEAEFDRIRIDISVLSELQAMPVDNREQLLEQLQPGVDGLLMEDRGYRSTFLPKVWDKIASAEAFVEQLLLKAGLPARHWSDTIRFQRYQAESFGEN